MNNRFAKYGGITADDLPMDQEPYQPSGEQILYPTINYQLAVRDCADLVADIPVSNQPLYASGMYAAISLLAPWLAERFLERLRTNPSCADTADVMAEQIYFLGPNDRGDRR